MARDLPAEIRKLLGIGPGTQLDFKIEGQTLRVDIARRATPTRLEDGYGLLVCKRPGDRRLSDFDVAEC